MAKNNREQKLQDIVNSINARVTGSEGGASPEEIAFVQRIEALTAKTKQGGVDAQMVQIPATTLKAMQDLVSELKVELAKTKKENTDLKQQILFDKLTGAHSLVAFAEHGQEQLTAIQFAELDQKNKRKHYNPPLPSTVVAIDMDGFKQINDNLGHDAGDRALKHFADFMRDNLRDEDFVARKGGDEFAIIFQGTEEEAVKKMLALRDKFVQEEFKHTGKIVGGKLQGKEVEDAPVYLSFSFGAHQLSPKDKDFSEAFSAADTKAIEDKGTKLPRWKAWEKEHHVRITEAPTAKAAAKSAVR